MAWFKLQEGISTNGKFMVIAKKSRLKVFVVVAVWIALLDHASQSEERGCLETFDCETLEVFYGLKAGDCQRVIAVMEEKGLICNGRIANWEKYQGEYGQSSGPKSNADRQKEYRERQKGQSNGTVTASNEAVTKRNAPVTGSNDGVTPSNDAVTGVTKSNALLKDKIREEENFNTKSIKACAEPQSGPTPSAPQAVPPPQALQPGVLLPTEAKQPDPAVIELPIVGNPEQPMHKVFASDLAKWQELYPGVDVIQQLRNMRGWLDANPSKRKTKTGIARFITSWLAKEQNSAARASPPNYPAAPTEYQQRKQESRLMAKAILQYKPEDFYDGIDALETTASLPSGPRQCGLSG